jgi:NTP pyrophosphatase (non-canonical NTP hydrolase)
MYSYLNDLIETVAELRRQMWPTAAKMNMVDVDHMFATLLEEAGEFRGAIKSFLGRPFSPEKTATRKDMVDELGDALVPLIALANIAGITFEEALGSAIIKLTKRRDKHLKAGMNSREGRTDQ